MDWKTGEVNAKYYAIQMLALLGAGPKSFLNADIELPPVPPPPPPPPGIHDLDDCIARAKSCKMVCCTLKHHTILAPPGTTLQPQSKRIVADFSTEFSTTHCASI